MIAILSPAKRMRACFLPGRTLSKPLFLEQAGELAAILRECSPWQLERLLNVNPALALSAFDKYQAFLADGTGSPALLAYQGLAYQHLDAPSLTGEDFDFARDHLRLLSALYGMLRPEDAIEPYRLELLSRLKAGGQSLYHYWGERVYEALFAQHAPVVNLASAEYAKLVTPYLQPNDTFITCTFLTPRRGKRVTLATEAKMARGELARYLILNRLTQPEELKSFTFHGYTYTPQLSSSHTLTYLKEAP